VFHREVGKVEDVKLPGCAAAAAAAIAPMERRRKWQERPAAPTAAAAAASSILDGRRNQRMIEARGGIKTDVERDLVPGEYHRATPGDGHGALIEDLRVPEARALLLIVAVAQTGIADQLAPSSHVFSIISTLTAGI
jgi:hypothetical protein